MKQRDMYYFGRLALSVMIVAGFVVCGGKVAHAQLFAGLEGSTPMAQSTDLSGFPDVGWSNEFAFDVSGAAATPDGMLYLCNGAFTTKLYSATLGGGSPDYLVTIDKDMSALAYGRGHLYGYSNYATPKGIYEINPDTGVTTLALDVYTDTGFRFFALDYNPVDDLFYGYTEYGDSGLYSINIDTGEMLKLQGTIPASNGQGRGLAVGRNAVYLTATRGDDEIPYFAYDISQGVGGEWVAFTQPFPAYHSTGGAAYVTQAGHDIQLSIEGECPGFVQITTISGTAFGDVALVYAYGEGSFTIPGGVCAGTELGLNGTVKLATVLMADSDGVASLVRELPASICGGEIVVQAIDLSTCAASNVVPTP